VAALVVVAVALAAPLVLLDFPMLEQPAVAAANAAAVASVRIRFVEGLMGENLR
jgi:hypothetical protein